MECDAAGRINYVGLFGLEDGKGRRSRNVGNQLPTYAA
jgi:hypothetical protein